MTLAKSLPPPGSPSALTGKCRTRRSGTDSEARKGLTSSKAFGPLPLRPPGREDVGEGPPTFAVNLAILVGQGGGLEAFAALSAPEAGLMPGLGREGSS